jgi:hypothetical protein
MTVLPRNRVVVLITRTLGLYIGMGIKKNLENKSAGRGGSENWKFRFPEAFLTYIGVHLPLTEFSIINTRKSINTFWKNGKLQQTTGGRNK